MSLPIRPNGTNSLDSILKNFEKADNKTIQIALEVIRSSSRSSSPLPMSTSEAVPSNPLIQNLFDALTKNAPSVEWVQEQGYESVEEWVERRLEHCLWNHIEASSSLDPTYDGLSSFILARPALKKIPAINIPSDEAIDRLSYSLLQEDLNREEEGVSLEREFEYFCEKVEKRFAYLIGKETNETRKSELSRMQAEFEKLKNRIEMHPKAELFSEDDQERKEQYYKFGVRLGIAFAGLLEQKSEELLFQRIAEFLDTCFKGWDEHTLQLMAMGSVESVYLNPLIEAQKVACIIRRSVVEQALAETFQGFENDVHYQNAAKWAMNKSFHLGFSKEELGTLEPDMVQLVIPMMRKKTKELLASKGKDELIAQLISRYKAIASEEEKKEVFSEVLAQYVEKVKEDPSFLIDPLQDLELAFKQFLSSETREDLKKLKNALQEKGITPSSTKLFYEKTPEEILKTIRDNRDFFVNLRALYNRDLLARKFEEEEQFGAFAWAIQAKVLHLEDSPKEDLNVRILHWIQKLPFSESQQEQIFKVLAHSIEALENGETKTALQACLASKNLSALLDLQSEPETFSSLEEILCFGSVEDLRLWKQIHPIDKEDLITAFRLLVESGKVAILQELLSDHSDILEEYRGPAVELSSKNGHLEMVLWLLNSGVISLEDRSNAVAEAIKKEHVDVVRELLKNGAQIRDGIRSEGIAFAIEKNNLDLVKALLEGAVISEKDRGRAVRAAADRGYLNLIQLLLNGAVISEEDRSEAICVAIKRHDLNIVHELLGSGEAISEEHRGYAVVLAAGEGFLDLVKALLEGAVISQEARENAVVLAAWSGHIEVIEELLRGGAISESCKRLAISSAGDDPRKEAIIDLINSFTGS